MEDAPKKVDDPDYVRAIVDEALDDAIADSVGDLQKKMNYNSTTYVVPDYEDRCISCKSRPTVVVKRGQQEHKTHLCGVCCWGEAECIDPANW